MAQMADVPAHERISEIVREAARLEAQPEAPISSAALLYVASARSLIPRHQVQEPDHHHAAPDTAITLCAEHAASASQETHSCGPCLPVSLHVSRAD